MYVLRLISYQPELGLDVQFNGSGIECLLCIHHFENVELKYISKS